MNNTTSCIILAALSSLLSFLSGEIEFVYVATFYIGVGFICSSIDKGNKK